MELLSRDIKFGKQLQIVESGDWHLLARACDEKKIKRMLKFVLDSQDTYLSINGDMFDMIGKRDLKRFNVSCIDERFLKEIDRLPDFCVEYGCDLLRNLADAGKILSIGMGNHELHFYQNSGTNVIKELSRRLNVPYGGYSSMTRLTISKLKGDKTKRNVVIYRHHGLGSSRTDGGSLNGITKMMESWEADVYVMGHDHRAPNCVKDFIRVPQTGKMRLIKERKLFVRTSSYLRTVTVGEDPTYSEVRYPSVVPIGSPLICYDIAGTTHEKKFWVNEEYYATE